MSALTEAAPPSEPPPAQALPRSFWHNLSVMDWLVFAYMATLNLAVMQGQRGPSMGPSLLRAGSLTLFFIVGLVLVRGELLRDGLAKSFLYRVVIYAPVQLSYFFFRELLPHINPGALDQELYALDLTLFGVEPALVFDRMVTPATTEWFAFFYFGYFFVLALHVIPIQFFSRDQRLVGEFALGMLLVFCIGHTGYMLVPGFGPYQAFAHEFQSSFPRGLWLDLVMDTVHSGGAQKDIFPSLHTAGPTFIALFSYRFRHRLPFTFTWPLVAFYALNIIIATMFLRWHYLIDVVAGLVLATGAALAVPHLIDWELTRRARNTLSPLWPEIGTRS